MSRWRARRWTRTTTPRQRWRPWGPGLSCCAPQVTNSNRLAHSKSELRSEVHIMLLTPVLLIETSSLTSEWTSFQYDQYRGAVNNRGVQGNTSGSTTSAWSARCAESVLATGLAVSAPPGLTETPGCSAAAAVETAAVQPAGPAGSAVERPDLTWRRWEGGGGELSLSEISSGWT